jgi:hypothetical protein
MEPMVVLFGLFGFFVVFFRFFREVSCDKNGDDNKSKCITKPLKIADSLQQRNFF